MTQPRTEESKPPIPRKLYYTDIPTIYEQQLTPRVLSTRNVGRPLDIMAKSYIVALTGPRGGIKSGSLAYLSIWALAKGHRVLTNLPVKCNLKRVSGVTELLESEPLDVQTIIMEPQTLEGSLIAWDEYQQWDRSGTHQTMQHRLLIASWEQIRKHEISFAYVAKRINLVPGDVAWETDLEFNCQDVSNTGKGEIEGTRCGWEIKDLSGLWTRKMYNPKHPESYHAGFYHRAIMGAYDTRQRFDPLEAARGYAVNLTKNVISDHESESDFIDEDAYQTIKDHALEALPAPSRRSIFFSNFGIYKSTVRDYVQSRLMEDLDIEEITRSGVSWLRVREREPSKT